MDLLETLSRIGVLDVEVVRHQTAAEENTMILDNNLATHFAFDFIDSAPRVAKLAKITPSSQPSAFWKAYANAIVPLLSNSSDLSDDSQVLFLTTPTQAGIPGGQFVPTEVTNSQVYIKADTVQKVNHPTYSLDGPSYFQLLTMYLRSVTSTAESSIMQQCRTELLDATETKKRAWNDGFERYEALKNSNPATLPTFADYMTADPEYVEAWNREQALENKYTGLQPPTMVDISRQLDILKSADDRHVAKTINNMPCTTANPDFVHSTANGKAKAAVDSTNTYYRPFHQLPNWETICNTWIDESGDRSKDTKFDINFQDLVDVTWKSFGHTELDSAPPMKLNGEDMAAISQLRGHINFIGKPMAIDVERGLWDIKGLRYLEPLSETAPRVVTQPFCKTTKFLMAQGFDIVLELPETIGTMSVGKVNLSGLRLPESRRSADGRTITFTTGQRNYPWIVGVLAELV